MSKVDKVLLKMEKMWKNSEARSKSDGIPDGKYQAKITSAAIDKSKAGRLQTIIKFKIVSGKHKGRIVVKYDGLETPDNIGWLKSTLRTMGLKIPSKILNLQKVLEKLEEELCVIQVKTSGEFTNTYIQSKIEDIDDEDDDDEEFDEDTEEEEDDDEEEEEEEKPKKKKKSKKKVKKKKKKKPVSDDDEDDDDEDGLEDADDEDEDEDDDEED